LGHFLQRNSDYYLLACFSTLLFLLGKFWLITYVAMRALAKSIFLENKSQKSAATNSSNAKIFQNFFEVATLLL